jgi:hypothetical protein
MNLGCVRLNTCILFNHTLVLYRARGGAVSWGTALLTGMSRVRFPMVSLEFFNDTILLVALWSWGVKAAGAQGWQPCHLHVLIVMKSGSLNLLEPLGPLQACNGIALPLTVLYSSWQACCLLCYCCELLLIIGTFLFSAGTHDIHALVLGRAITGISAFSWNGIC